MALDDRDRTFERALARHLRYVAPAGNEADSPLSVLCPDPEILAAYHDGSLTPEECALWKQHVLSCDGCQLVLEHLATQLDVPVKSDAEQEILAIPAAAAAAPTAVPAPATAAPAPVVLAPRKHYFRWLAPAGAIAAGLLTWVVIREFPRPLRSSPDDLRFARQAKNQQPPALTSPGEALHAYQSAPSALTKQENPPAEPSKADSSLAKAKDLRAGSLPGGLPANQLVSPKASSADAEKEASRLRQDLAKRKSAPMSAFLYDTPKPAELKKAPAAAGVSGAANARDDLSAQVTELQNDMKKQGVATQAALPPGGERGFLDTNAAKAPAAPKAAPAPGAYDNAAAGGAAPTPSAAPPPKPEEKAGRANEQVADSISLGRSSESIEVIGAAPKGVAKLRATLLQNPHVFGPRGTKILWRVGAAGLLQRSKDNGNHWMFQTSGVLTDLVAGSAPSAKVSWVVGAAGTILRTTDGGTHWIKLDSPSAADLAGVTATDVLHAYIWFVPDPRTGLVPSYQTQDGGATWIEVPSAGNPNN